MHTAATIMYASVHEKAFHNQMLLPTLEKHKQKNDVSTFGKFFARNELQVCGENSLSVEPLLFCCQGGKGFI